MTTLLQQQGLGLQQWKQLAKEGCSAIRAMPWKSVGPGTVVWLPLPVSQNDVG